MATTTRLREGDLVYVALSTFRQQYARSRGAVPWTSQSVRDKGRIVGKKGKWAVKFENQEQPALLVRKAVHF
eukprot:2919114-Pleurochrysis_carterae.AAC.1